MKFVCMKCDSAMKLKRIESDAQSAHLTFICPDCGSGVAMVTNEKETQLVKALGLTGPKAEAQAEKATAQEVKVIWSKEAQERLSNIPSFARGMAQSGIEKYAAEKGYSEITGAVMDEARKLYGM